MTETKHPSTEQQGAALETAKLGIWAFLATEVLLFGGLFTAYTVLRVGDPHMFHIEYLKLNRLFGAINTVVLVTSSLTVALGVAAIRQGKQRLLKAFLSLTVLLAASSLSACGGDDPTSTCEGPVALTQGTWCITPTSTSNDCAASLPARFSLQGRRLTPAKSRGRLSTDCRNIDKMAVREQQSPLPEGPAGKKKGGRATPP